MLSLCWLLRRHSLHAIAHRVISRRVTVHACEHLHGRPRRGDRRKRQREGDQNREDDAQAVQGQGSFRALRYHEPAYRSVKTRVHEPWFRIHRATSGGRCTLDPNCGHRDERDRRRRIADDHDRYLGYRVRLSDVDLLHDLDRAVDLNAEIPISIFDLRLATRMRQAQHRRGTDCRPWSAPRCPLEPRSLRSARCRGVPSRSAGAAALASRRS